MKYFQFIKLIFSKKYRSRIIISSARPFLRSTLQITNLRARGMEFLDVPDSYYDMLRNRLEISGTKIVEDLDILQVLLLIISKNFGIAMRLLLIRMRYGFAEIKDINRL